MFRRSDEPVGLTSPRPEGRTRRRRGPGSRHDDPGHHRVRDRARDRRTAPVTRIEVDLGLDFTVGLHRAPSLAVAHRAEVRGDRRVAARTRQRKVPLPGLPRLARTRRRHSDRLRVARHRQLLDQAVPPDRALRRHHTVVAIASLPRTSSGRASDLADPSRGRTSCWSATRLMPSGCPGPSVPVAPWSRRTRRCRSRAAMAGAAATRSPRSFGGAARARSPRCSLRSTPSPRRWIDEYHLQVVMRHAGQIFPEMIANSYHGDHVRLIGEDLSRSTPRGLCADVVGARRRRSDGRLARVLGRDGLRHRHGRPCRRPPSRGRPGYVGGLLADLAQPASVHVRSGTRSGLQS